MLRPVVKEATERVLVDTGVHRLLRRRTRGKACILTYHNVVPDDAPEVGDRSLHIRESAFRRHLDVLQAECQIVPLSEVLEEAEAGHPGGNPAAPRVALTFDDAYRGAVTLAVEELHRRSLPAAIFVAPGLLGGQTLWWDAFAASDGDGVNPAWRDRMLRDQRGRPQEIRFHGRLEKREAAEMPPSMRTALEDELTEAVERDGVEVASHTWSHPNLTRLDAAQLREELARSRAWLHERYPERYLDVVSFPYGLHSPEVEAGVRNAGYRAGLSLEGGWVTPRSSDAPPTLPRLNIAAGVSPRGLRIRLI